MAVAPRIFATDEELGKRNDDHKPAKTGLWHFRRKLVIRRRRILSFIVFGLVVWAFVHNMPTDLGPARNRFGNYPSSTIAPATSVGTALDDRIDRLEPKIETIPFEKNRWQDDAAAPPRPSEEEAGDTARHYYNGAVKFYQLAETLREASWSGGQRANNKNIVFAASDLKTTSALSSLACEMDKWGRNHVHMVVMGRDDLPIEDIKDLNGIGRQSCDIYWHDARPDYGPYSTDDRMRFSVMGALRHVQTYLHPQAIITGDPALEDEFFGKGASAKARELNIPLIEVPQDNLGSMLWLARLDSVSLAAWHKASIDVLIQAQTEASGSLIRLLKSLLSADYSGVARPRLTIELPNNIDRPTKEFIDGLRWPPPQRNQINEPNLLILRHRISNGQISAEEASIRFLESFYPSNSKHNHVLLLSPQAELSPMYFHYIKYQLLQYKYSSFGLLDETNELLFGISLEVPSHHLNGSVGFTPPPSNTDSLSSSDDEAKVSPFLWQAPSTNAALYFGEKWVEIHSFLSRRLATGKNKRTKRPEKVFSSIYPAWAEYFLEYMQARSYTLMYPGLLPSSSSRAEGLVTIHDELYKPPEEFTAPHTKPDAASDNDRLLTANTDYLSSHRTPSDTASSVGEPPLLENLLQLLPHPRSQATADNRPPSHSHSHSPLSPSADEPLPDRPPAALPLFSLPLLTHASDPSTLTALTEASKLFATHFRATIGGCTPQRAQSKRVRLSGQQSADDLFCVDMDVDDSEVQAAVASAAKDADNLAGGAARDFTGYSPPPQSAYDEYDDDDDDDGDEKISDDDDAGDRKSAANIGTAVAIDGADAADAADSPHAESEGPAVPTDLREGIENAEADADADADRMAPGVVKKLLEDVA